MASIQNITFDAADPVAQARFWAGVLGREVADGSGEYIAVLRGEPTLLFLQVPESKAAKNRMHVDLDCDDLDAERARLEGLGATFVHEKHEFGLRWMTFRDPEGNEFCAAHHE
jgi:predicted enzyme related to lactoylglutathione lyase